MKIGGYGNIRRIVGIQHLTSAIYYNNIQHRKQQRKNIERERFLIGPRQTNETQKIYKTKDVELIYFEEYCKARNKRIYHQLNPNTMGNSLNCVKDTEPNNVKISRMLNAYNKHKRKSKIETEKNINKSKNKKDKNDKKHKEKMITKQEEMKQFKNSIKTNQNELSELDKAAIKFEQALKERKEYDKELRKNGGYRIVKGRRSPGFDR